MQSYDDDWFVIAYDRSDGRFLIDGVGVGSLQTSVVFDLIVSNISDVLWFGAGSMFDGKFDVPRSDFGSSVFEVTLALIPYCGFNGVSL